MIFKGFWGVYCTMIKWGILHMKKIWIYIFYNICNYALIYLISIYQCFWSVTAYLICEESRAAQCGPTHLHPRKNNRQCSWFFCVPAYAATPQQMKTYLLFRWSWRSTTMPCSIIELDGLYSVWLLTTSSHLCIIYIYQWSPNFLCITYHFLNNHPIFFFI